MTKQEWQSAAYVTRVLESLSEVDAAAWDALLAAQPAPTPFMRHAWLHALESSGCASTPSGWTPRVITLWHDGRLAAAAPVYLKRHSYGEYVFDWAWAEAYARHGLPYYPKAVVAVPFTPVPGTRLLALDAAARAALARALVAWCSAQDLSSLHLLFGHESDLLACDSAGMGRRHGVQFHWQRPEGVVDFDAFLASLNQEKRKKIRQERRKVAEAGVSFRWSRGPDIAAGDWAFFYQCYERTYLEHGNAPYLSKAFFDLTLDRMPQNWLLFVAERAGRPIASSLIALGEEPGEAPDSIRRIAYGRYWGAIERVDCLHFEACYYQPIAWCLTNGHDRFEGGAQGEHKMARALLPVRTASAHWLAHPGFARAVEDFLAREGRGIENYLGELEARSPLRRAGHRRDPA